MGSTRIMAAWRLASPAAGAITQLAVIRSSVLRYILLEKDNDTYRSMLMVGDRNPHKSHGKPTCEVDGKGQIVGVDERKRGNDSLGT